MKTDQEKFWEGEFGDNYIDRNQSEALHAANLKFFSTVLSRTGKVDSVFEHGANIGMNIRALKTLLPNSEMGGLEINKAAFEQLRDLIGDGALNNSIFDFKPSKEYDLSFTKGVLIHLNPNMLSVAYEKLYQTSKKYILIAEYYNPTPVSISYRGHNEKLFKRDFAGEFLQKYTDCELVDYGFLYRGDLNFPQDDITWFLIKKNI